MNQPSDDRQQPNTASQLSETGRKRSTGNGEAPRNTEIELGDIVRLKHPYVPAVPGGRNNAIGGTFTHGIVVEIVSRQRGPDSRSRNVSLHLFNPLTRTMYLHPRGPGANLLPEHVDFHVSELVLVHKAEEGYKNRDPATLPSGPSDAAGLRETVEEFIPDEGALYARLEPLLSELEERGLITSTTPIAGGVSNPPRVLVIGNGPDGQVGLAMDVARRIGWTVNSESCGGGETDQHDAATWRYVLIPDDHKRVYENAEGSPFQ